MTVLRLLSRSGRDCPSSCAVPHIPPEYIKRTEETNVKKYNDIFYKLNKPHQLVDSFKILLIIQILNIIICLSNYGSFRKNNFWHSFQLQEVIRWSPISSYFVLPCMWDTSVLHLENRGVWNNFKAQFTDLTAKCHMKGRTNFRDEKKLYHVFRSQGMFLEVHVHPNPTRDHI